MDTCVVCGGVEFYTESGFYYCQQCETQQENRREDVFEYAGDASTFVTKKRIERPRRVAADIKNKSLGWTSWETFNIILNGWTNELIILGASPNIKITVLQLWATYLGKLEVAFRSFTSQCLPRLPIAYRKKDSEIVYGEEKSGVKRKRRKRGSNPSSDGDSTHAGDISFGRLLAQRRKKMIDVEYQKYLDSSGSETEGASSANQNLQSVKSDGVPVQKKRGPFLLFNKLARAQKKTAVMETKNLPVKERAAVRNWKLQAHRASVEHLSLSDLLAVIILALRLNDEKIHLSDMIRFQHEGHMTTRKLAHFFPNDEPIPKDFRLAYCGYSYEALHDTAGELAKFLGVLEIPEPNIVDLIRRYCTDLQLPNGIALYAERMIALSPPKLTLGKWRKGLPHYEAKAMSVILIVMKILFGLDGVTEYEISRVVSKINSNLSSILQFPNKFKLTQINEQMDPKSSCIIVHGGLTTENDPYLMEKVSSCINSASRGYKALLSNQTSVDAVEDALWWLENDEFLNCGYGCSPNEHNIVQMDASMMNGTTKQCGTVLGLKDVEHPISVARYVMENYRNKIFSNELMKRMKNIPRFWMTAGNMGPVYERKDEVKSIISKYLEMGQLNLTTNNSCGCISWDGENLVVGTTGGGPRGKPSGAVSDAGIIGCGLFASDTIACAITGPVRPLINLNLASKIVEEMDNLKSCPEKTLKKHIDMLKESDESAGGIIMHSSGCAGIYFTAPRMPYAVVQNKCIVYGWDVYNRHYQKLAEENDALDSKLFNFIEWQRYIECRRTVIMSQHSGTRFRLDPESPCQNVSEYLSYLKKFIIPEENMDPCRAKVMKQLGEAMDQNMANLAENLPEMERARVFEPSFTPMHSYLQELLKDDEMDLPSLLKQNFSSMKIGYMTNTETFKELAKECGINLKIIDSSANFLERIIPTTGSQLLNSDINEQSKSTPVIIPNTKKQKKCDDPSSYLHFKNTGKIFIDEKKQALYHKNLENSNKNRKNLENDFDDFAFDQVRSDGKLNILEFDDDSDSDDDVNNSQVFNDENLLLSNFERESLKSGVKSHWHSEKKTSKCKERNSSLLKNGDEGSNKCDCIMCMKFDTTRRKKKCLSNANEDEEEENGETDDVTVIHDEDDDLTIVNEVSNNTSDFDKDEISILSEKTNRTRRQTETTFRPYRDYWLHRKSAKDHSAETLLRWNMLERDLPINFRWLLNECAKMIEVDAPVLYYKLAFMESYYADCLVGNYDHGRAEKFYDALDHRDSRQTRTLAQKWINDYKKRER